MNKYTKQATLQLAGVALVAIVVSLSFSLLATTFGLPTVMMGLGMLAFAYCAYNFIRIQADILESRDKLKNKE